MRGTLLIGVMLALPALFTSAAAEECAAQKGEVRLSTRKPVDDPEARLTSGFGLRRHPILGSTRLHTGVDWAAARGAPVVAAAAGRVTYAGFKEQYGRTVIIDHGGGLVTLYAHLQEIAVAEGACVASRARIGAVGSTGLTAMVAVHFEVRRAGTAVDPFAVAILGD